MSCSSVVIDIGFYNVLSVSDCQQMFVQEVTLPPGSKKNEKSTFLAPVYSTWKSTLSCDPDTGPGWSAGETGLSGEKSGM